MIQVGVIRGCELVKMKLKHVTYKKDSNGRADS